MKKKGYVCETQFAVNYVEQNEEQSMGRHYEKLALAFEKLAHAFGLLTLPSGVSLISSKRI